jgi:hypothetical protein
MEPKGRAVEGRVTPGKELTVSAPSNLARKTMLPDMIFISKAVERLASVHADAHNWS